ncbi:DUF1566 domain-containing protein [bacterium]|nr:DUF1566 domain-containing protein [bacterium]
MKKYFLLFALILIFSVSACGKKSENQAIPGQNDADETAETADNEQNNDDNDNEQNNNEDDNSSDDDEVLPDPCEPDPCKKISHAGECKRFTFKTFVCECDKGWFWDGEKCISPCDVDPCKGISHATGACSATMSDQYLCECETGFFWNGENCVDPCENNNCGNIANAVDECIGKNAWSYDCKCTDSYFWYESACVKSPCASNSCGDDAHIECVAEDATNYRCRCENGYFSDGEKCVDLPECSPESGTPCKDSVTGLVWSTKLFDNWKALKCTELSEGGFTDWRRPTISQLRTLIQNCPNTETGGACPIYDEYLNENTCGEKCSSCEERDSGKYSKFGDTEIFWSSTLCSEFYVVNFSNGAIYGSCNYDDAFWGEFSGPIPPADCTGYFLRCTRCYEGYFWYEDKCIESPCNSNPCGEIPHIRCVPLSKTNYRCICEDRYYLNGEECVSY